jgi:hypothetical protein
MREPLQVTVGAHFIGFMTIFLYFWCGRRDLNPQAFWALAPKASVFAISPLPHGAAAQAGPAPFKSRVKTTRVAMRTRRCARKDASYFLSLEKSPLLPPDLDSRRMSRMTMALSSALVMS